MHPRLADFISAFSNIDSFDIIDIITNATIIPNAQIIKALIRESRVRIRISNYGELSTRLDQLVLLMEEHNIEYEVIDYQEWYKKPLIDILNEKDAEIIHKFKCCMNGNHPCISNGKLFLCKAAMALCEIGVFPASNDNFLDLTSLRDKTECSRNSIIIDYINRRDSNDYIDACKYCSGKVSTNTNEAIVLPAIQAKEEIKMDALIIK